MLTSLYCPDCQSPNLTPHSQYETKSNGLRSLYRCQVCHLLFAETANSPMHHIKSPISKVASVLKVRSEGLGLRATARCFGMNKRTISQWEERFASLKDTLKLYLICHHFIQLTFEGDEVYTRVHHNRPADQSPGWTIFLMERASRFILESQCGKKEQALFWKVLTELAKLVDYTQDLRLFTDGERRYGQILFELCAQAWRSRGRRQRVLPPHVSVRLKNKGSQRTTSQKRPKYEAPVCHHWNSPRIEEEDIHGNHIEAMNGSLRRRNSAFRRRSNTYAKHQPGLQRTLDVNWVIHNFVRPHFTTGQIPAVALGIVERGFALTELLAMPRFNA